MDALFKERPRAFSSKLGDLSPDEAHRVLSEGRAKIAAGATLPGWTTADLSRLGEDIDDLGRSIGRFRKRWPAYPDDLLQLLYSATMVVADEVLGLDLEILEDLSFAPPYDNLWLEVALPRGSGYEFCGWHLVTHDLSQPTVLSGLQALTGAEHWSDQSRWAVNISWFVRVAGANEGPMATWFMHLDGHGRLLGVWAVNEDGDFVANLESDSFSGWWWMTLLKSLALMNCKNIGYRNVVPPDRLSAAHRKRHGHALVRYRVLDIGGIRFPSGASTPSSRTQALHFVRGHFKTYTADRPLFGRVTGTFYWPVHTAGSSASGTVLKDYRIRASR